VDRFGGYAGHAHRTRGRADDRLDHVAAEVGLADDRVRVEIEIRLHGTPSPAVRRETARAIGQHVATRVDAQPGHDDALLVVLRVRSAARVDGHDDARQIGRHRSSVVKHGVRPQGADDVVEQLAADLLTAEPRATVALQTTLEQLGEVRIVVGRRARDGGRRRRSSSRSSFLGFGVVGRDRSDADRCGVRIADDYNSPASASHPRPRRNSDCRQPAGSTSSGPCAPNSFASAPDGQSTACRRDG
jgi:hypothetical protein